ncbi:MAG: peptidoglycan DD-metalloendopeptidase family protein [Anaerolineales bacterium]
MTEQFQEVAPQANQGNGPASEPSNLTPPPQRRTNWLESLARLGLGEIVVRIGTNLLTLVAVCAVVWLMSSFYKVPQADEAANAANRPTPVPQVDIASIPQAQVNYQGVGRMASIHTNIPNRPREDVVKYTVQAGDTVIGIAKKFNLKPESILFGNYNSLADNPEDNLVPGLQLNILPIDGIYRQWQDGEGLNSVARFYSVKPEDIINYPLNHLDLATIGDYSHPNITPGAWLIIPGGTRELSTFNMPDITRNSPAVARIAGSGTCGAVKDGAVGIGSFIWPSQNHYLSGYDYSAIHRGIDIAGNLGEAVWAVDAGVIVYAGWNEYGYGNMIMIDHGNGWQSLYAHLSSIKVVCGQSVDQGTIIGAIGTSGNSSGPHLHFELMHTLYSKVNPWDFLH